MSEHPADRRDRPEDDPLDQLLGEARWPAPFPESESRLAKRWQVVRSAQHRRDQFVRRAALLAIAASVVLTLTLGRSWLRRNDKLVGRPAVVLPPGRTDEEKPRPIAPVAKQPGSVHIVQRPTSITPAIAVRPPRLDPGQTKLTVETEAVAYSRPPNDWEAILIAGSVRPRRDQKQTVVRQEVTPPKPQAPKGPTKTQGTSAARLAKRHERELQADRKRAVAQAAVQRLIAEPKTNAQLASEPLRTAPDEYEQPLSAILANGSPLEQLSALRLLGEIGRPTVIPALLEASAKPNLHAAAIVALARRVDVPTINELINRENDSQLQRTLLGNLLARGDARSVRDYLAFVESDAFGDTALSAANLVQNPPMDLLFGFLQSPSQIDRLAAARVIGRIDGPITTERLIAMVEQGTSRQEACVALLSSRGEEAVSFVNSARANPLLAGLMQAASLYVPNTSQPRS